MKLLGFSAGRKMGNTEVLVKEALMGAEEAGVQVEFVRLLDMDLKGCLFCKTCLKMIKGFDACVIKDDGQFLYDVVMDSDAIILGTPVYALDRPGILKMFEDRMLGPHVDAAGAREQIKHGEVNQITGKKVPVDRRILKMRVGGLIVDGGASTPNWLSFALPLLYTFTFPPQIEIIDHLVVYKCQPWPLGTPVLQDKAIARARLLGRHVAEAMKKPIEEVRWMGDDIGICPVCHCNLIMITNYQNPVECPVCGISGTLKLENGKISVDFSAEERARSHLTLAGKLEHQIEIQNVVKELAPRFGEVEGKIAKYKNYLTPLTPPKKSISEKRKLAAPSARKKTKQVKKQVTKKKSKAKRR